MNSSSMSMSMSNGNESSPPVSVSQASSKSNSNHDRRHLHGRSASSHQYNQGTAQHAYANGEGRAISTPTSSGTGATVAGAAAARDLGRRWNGCPCNYIRGGNQNDDCVYDYDGSPFADDCRLLFHLCILSDIAEYINDGDLEFCLKQLSSCAMYLYFIVPTDLEFTSMIKADYSFDDTEAIHRTAEEYQLLLSACNWRLVGNSIWESTLLCAESRMQNKIAHVLFKPQAN